MSKKHGAHAVKIELPRLSSRGSSCKVKTDASATLSNRKGKMKKAKAEAKAK